MKMDNYFWLNMEMKNGKLTYVLNWISQNSYFSYEFWYGIKKQNVENYVGFPMIFFKNIRMLFIVTNFYLMKHVLNIFKSN